MFWKKQKNEPLLEGLTLEQIMAHPSEKGRSVPRVIEDLMLRVRKDGLREDGIFRLSASKDKIDQLYKCLDNKHTSYNEKRLAIQKAEIHTVAGVFKKILRDMPDGVVPFNMVDEFLPVGMCQDRAERVEKLRALVKKLPKCRFALLKEVVELLDAVAANSDANRMDTKNLAVVFTPCLLRKPCSNPILEMSNVSSLGCCVVEMVVSFFAIFDDLGLGESKKRPSTVNPATAEECDIRTPAVKRPTTGKERRSLVQFVCTPIHEESPEKKLEEELTELRKKYDALASEKNSIKMRLVEFDVEFFKANKRLPKTSDRAPLRSEYERYNAVKDQTVALLAEATTKIVDLFACKGLKNDFVEDNVRANPELYLPLPEKYAPLTGEKLADALKELQSEKDRVDAQLALFIGDFRKKNGRDPKSSMEMYPQLANYNRKEEIKHLMELIRFKMQNEDM